MLWMSLLAGVYACNSGQQKPDVSAFSASVTTQRFDQSFFALDTNQLVPGLNQLQQQYPGFLQNYLSSMLGINPGDPQALAAITAFLRSYTPVYEVANGVANQHLPQLEKDMVEMLRYLQHYVPGYKPDSPFVITTFISPMDAYEPFAIGDYGDVRTQNGVGIALQLHLGEQAQVYDEGKRAGVFFDYQTRRFTPATMLVNATKNLIEDEFPYKPESLTLLEDMVEKGKRMALLQRLLPDVPDSLQLGYTGKQVKGCEANEALIWNFFMKNDLLYSKDPLINQGYLKDGPKTQELGEGAPGYIALFVGRQIVNAYLTKFPDTKFPDLMKMPARQLFEQAGYKP